MTSKKFLSNKRTAQQTISISPALKEWIERYVNVNRKNNPKDSRFGSISSFYNYIMEKNMEILEHGKTLDDFERFVDSKTRNFFDRITFRGVLPFHEDMVRTHKYTHLNFKRLTSFLFAVRNLYLEGVEPNDYNKLMENFQILKNFFLENNIIKKTRLELITKGDSRSPKAIFEFIGNYKNLFWENCKLNAAVFGIIGAKITEVIYSDKDLYCRFNLDSTDLIFRKDLAKKERIKLVNDNMNLLINYRQIINDKDFYLWMKLAGDKEIYINFNNESTQKRWLEIISEDINQFGEITDNSLDFLKFFEKLHWIDIESEKDLSFRFRLSKEKNHEEIKFLINSLSKHSKVTQLNGIYNLE
ncbi:MAG: hypothetical protein ACFFDX_09290 [Candidatus Odinarchaeota archaeon]